MAEDSREHAAEGDAEDDVTIFLIDGYNLLHALLKMERRGGRDLDLEQERIRLLDRLASYMGGRKDRAIAVFDSNKSKLEKAQYTSRNVEAYFGSFQRSADAIIERAAYELRQDETIVVVTSDYALQQTVFSPNAGNHSVVRQSSAQFIAEMSADAMQVAKKSNGPKVEHRVEDALSPESAAKLRQLRDRLAKEDRSARGEAE